jgi:hypothetical protein
MVILRLSITQCKEIRAQAAHNVRLCQKVAVLYNVRIKTLIFRKSCHRQKGTLASQQCFCHKSNTRCCVYSRNTVYSWAQLLLNDGGIHISAKYWNVHFTQNVWNSRAAVDAREIALHYSGWRHPSTTVLNECNRISLRHFWIEVAHEL